MKRRFEHSPKKESGFDLWVIYFVVISLVLICLFYFDISIIKWVSGIRTLFLDNLFNKILLISMPIVIVGFLTLLFLAKKKRKWVLPLWATVLFATALNFILKVTIQRLRPFQRGIIEIFSSVEKLSHSVWNFSFPSFHAMIVFSALPIISKEYPKLKYPWIIYGILVMASRVYFGLHFLSDVIVGSLLGLMVGFVFLEIEKETKFCQKFSKRLFHKKRH